MIIEYFFCLFLQIVTTKKCRKKRIFWNRLGLRKRMVPSHTVSAAQFVKVWPFAKANFLKHGLQIFRVKFLSQIFPYSPTSDFSPNLTYFRFHKTFRIPLLPINLSHERGSQNRVVYFPRKNRYSPSQNNRIYPWRVVFGQNDIVFMFWAVLALFVPVLSFFKTIFQKPPLF